MAPCACCSHSLPHPGRKLADRAKTQRKLATLDMELTNLGAEKGSSGDGAPALDESKQAAGGGTGGDAAAAAASPPAFKALPRQATRGSTDLVDTSDFETFNASKLASMQQQQSAAAGESGGSGRLQLPLLSSAGKDDFFSDPSGAPAAPPMTPPVAPPIAQSLTRPSRSSAIIGGPGGAPPLAPAPAPPPPPAVPGVPRVPPVPPASATAGGAGGIPDAPPF